MTIARVQGNSADVTGIGSPISVTISAVGNGNSICGIVSWDNSSSATINNITDDKGNTYNLEAKTVNTTDTQAAQAFSRTNITNAPVTISANFSVTTTFRKIVVSEFSGTSTASTDERDGAAHGGQFQATPGTGTDAITSGTFTTSTNGDLIYGATMIASSTTLATHGTSFTNGTQNNTTYVAQDEWREQATAGAGTAATFTKTPANPEVTFIIAVKPAAAADTLHPQIQL